MGRLTVAAVSVWVAGVCISAQCSSALYGADAGSSPRGGGGCDAWYYPQMSMELYRLEELKRNAQAAGMYVGYPGSVPPYAAAVEFRRRFKPGETREYFTHGRAFSENFDEKTGMLRVSVSARYLDTPALRSPLKGWEARVSGPQRDDTWRAAARYSGGEVPPHLRWLEEDHDYRDLKKIGDYYDTQRELLAYVQTSGEKPPKLFVGESVPEMRNTVPVDSEQATDMVLVANDTWRSRSALALRYFRFEGKAEKVKVIPLWWPGMEEKGTFSAKDKRHEKMREVGVHTLKLCCHDFLIDGIKRDRLPWGGDLTVSLMANAYVLGDPEISRRSLSVLDAYTTDVNGIVTYSMWLIIAHDLHQLYFADREFLEARWWRIKQRIEDLISRTDENGFVARGLDWVFIDWAGPRSATALGMIWTGALDAAAKLAGRINDPRAAEYRALCDKVKANLNRLAWDEGRKLYRVDPFEKNSGFARQANIYAVIFGVAQNERAQAIGDELAKDDLPAVGTPYVFGWELVALARTGHHKEFFTGMETVFGAMLDAGATSFWEGFNAKQKGDERYRFYGRPWAKSLCHAWSAWPAFIFVSEAMGVKPTSDGWKTHEVKPIPGAEGMKADIPTPSGHTKIGL